MTYPLRMTIVVATGNQHRYQLYERTIFTPWLPDTNDSIFLYEDVSWYIKNRYMDGEGNWTLELRGAILDPDDDTADMLEKSSVGGATWRTWQPWRTPSDGDLVGKMLGAGWMVWHS